jgi:hypothetical protein
MLRRLSGGFRGSLVGAEEEDLRSTTMMIMLAPQ